MTRIAIADDHPIIISGAEALLRDTQFDVVASFADGAALLEGLSQINPDIVLLDVEMPRCSGLEVLRTLRDRNDLLPVVLLTAGISERDAREAMELGVNGLVLKETAPGSLVRCLEEVRMGRRWIDQPILQRALEAARSPDIVPGDVFAALSHRERQVADGVVRGLRNRDIADALGIAEGTVKVHLHKVYEKLGIGSRTELLILRNEAP